MAENSETFCQAAARFIENRIRIPTHYVTSVPWQERERLFDRGEIHILWLCGLPYVHKADMAESGLELLAVPIPRGERYQGTPVYFSDVLVRRDRPFQSFADLRGASWAYNEPRSHSGFNVVRAHLAELGHLDDFFGTVVESGAHSASLEMVLSGRVDGSAIDSTVLEWLIAEREELADEIRVIDSFGPSPIPPWVISRQVPESLRSDIRALLLRMPTETFGRVMLDRARIDRFVAAEDRDYDPIRAIAKKAEQVSLYRLSC
ncbi:MAG: phosphate/phosphite/phosphonate ABC transporter substrate-binding protein [Candidatus Binatia bacterium]